MAKSNESKATASKAIKKPTKPVKKTVPVVNPQEAIKRTVTSASTLVEKLLKAIEARVPAEGAKGKLEVDQMFGPRGAIANLHKLVQVLDKLSGQLEYLGEGKKTEKTVTLTAEERQLLKDWLKR